MFENEKPSIIHYLNKIMGGWVGVRWVGATVCVRVRARLRARACTCDEYDNTILPRLIIIIINIIILYFKLHRILSVLNVVDLILSHYCIGA